MRPLLSVILAVPAALPAQWDVQSARATSQVGIGFPNATAVFDSATQALPWNVGLITPFHPFGHANATTSIDAPGATRTATQLGETQSSSARTDNRLDIWFRDVAATPSAPSYAVLTLDYEHTLTSFDPLSPPSLETVCTLTQSGIVNPIATWSHPGSTQPTSERPQFLAASYVIVSDLPSTSFLFEATASIGGSASGTGTAISDLNVGLHPIAGPQPNVTAASFGEGSAGAAGLVPTFRLRPMPTPQLAFEVGNSLGGSLAVAVASDVGPGPIAVTPQLSIDVGTPFTILDTRLLTGAGAGNGSATWVVNLPPALTTPYSAWLQCAVLDPAATDGFALSNGLFVTID